MRRYWEEHRPPSMMSASLMLRLTSGIGMLALISLLIVRMGDPSMWRWLTGEDGRAAENEAALDPPPLPDATGPTHEDPDQAVAAEEEYQAISDGTTTLQKVEMVPYERLVFWTKNQPFERMRRLGRGNLLYTHLYDEPAKHRGELVVMDVDVHRAIDAGHARDGTPLHEVIATTAKSWGRPYFLIVVDYPKNMPLGDKLSEKAKFTGYFLKLQGYEPAETQPGAPIQKAPLLIGRLDWKPPLEVKNDSSMEWLVGLSLLIVIVLVLGVSIIIARLRPRRTAAPRSIATSPAGEVISIESWLEQSDLNIDVGESNVDNDGPPPNREDLDV